MSLYLAVFGKPRYIGLVDIGELKLSAGSWIVIETLRGMEMGLLGGTLSLEQESKYRSACLDEASEDHTRGPEPMLQEVELVGLASASQIQERDARHLDEEAALIRSRQILRGHQFQMKLVDVEYTMDRKKLFLYFTSEQRVDFRAYVRDLVKEFRIRIEMRQIGVRDEAKTVRGVSPCGRPCCCSYWLHRFTPINIRMVKEQNLALNPTKISGICGRLMCCMFYEHYTYNELWKTLPSPGSKIKAPQGNYVLEGVDLHTEMVRVSFPEGIEVPIPVADFARFKETILRGETWHKEEEIDTKPRRPGLSRGMISSRIYARTKTYDTPEVFGKNNKKSKIEKISIEDHLAESVGEPHKPSQIPTSQEMQEAKVRIAAKKHQRRHKDVLPDSRRQERQRTQGTRGRNRQSEQRPRNEQADSSLKSAQNGVQAHNANIHNTHTRGVHSRRHKYKGGNRGRPCPGNTGATGKGDS